METQKGKMQVVKLAKGFTSSQMISAMITFGNYYMQLFYLLEHEMAIPNGN